MTLGSLFDGVGGWLVAAKKAGVTPRWASEIEDFPRQVTTHHFPEVEHLGDVTKIDGGEIKLVDIITSGSPCQSLSIAGRREGLEGESGLFRESTRVFHEMRDATGGLFPRFFVWENVMGAFSSNGGGDFRVVLEEITKTDIPSPPNNKWANAGVVQCENCQVAWRVLDAQYWGVAQRRKRIFLVADFGGNRATEILFEPESLSRNTTESRSEGENTSSETERSVNPTILDMTHYEEVIRESKDGVVQTLKHRMGTGGNNVPLILNDHVKTYDVRFTSDGTRNSRGHVYETDISIALDTAKQDPSTNHGGVAVVNDTAYCIAGNTIDRKLENGANGKGVNEDVSYTLNTIDRHAVWASKSYHDLDVENAPCAALRASGGALGGGSENIATTPSVRRLTPLECERLQGYGDNYTLIDGASDTARYKAIGNGMAQPCADFVIRRIAEVCANG